MGGAVRAGAMTDCGCGRWPAGPGGRQGEPALLLLHGLGATGDVWDDWQPLLARRWPGRWPGVAVTTLPGLGHNAQVESPDLSITLLDAHP
jgi:pimeloyl-ACP methyl ester carboxylesterase